MPAPWLAIVMPGKCHAVALAISGTIRGSVVAMLNTGSLAANRAVA
jgi:hypothetical protein